MKRRPISSKAIRQAVTGFWGRRPIAKRPEMHGQIAFGAPTVTKPKATFFRP